MPIPFDRSDACRSWQPYVRHLADLLRLRDWTIEVSGDAAPADSVAMIHLTNGRRHAILDLSDAFLADPDPASQRHTIVHELVHCHFEPAHVIAKALGDGRYDDFLLLYEYGTDAMADAVAPLLPLPDDTTTDEA